MDCAGRQKSRQGLVRDGRTFGAAGDKLSAVLEEFAGHLEELFGLVHVGGVGLDGARDGQMENVCVGGWSCEEMVIIEEGRRKDSLRPARGGEVVQGSWRQMHREHPSI